MQDGKIAIGLDVGVVSVKLVALVPTPLFERHFDNDRTRGLFRVLEPGDCGRLRLLVARYRRTKGNTLDTLREACTEALDHLGADNVGAVAVTGSSGARLASTLGIGAFNGFQALAKAVELLCPSARTVFEMGGESSKYLRLAPDATGTKLGIVDYSANGDCAAGTGSFLDQQAGRLEYAIEDLGDIVAQADRAAQIAGRCSVFAKSDMIHAQQKGFTPPEVLRGLCDAVATNYRSAVVKGRKIESPVALAGGVSANRAVVDALARTFDLCDGQLFVPEAAESFGAIGAAILASERGEAGGGGRGLASALAASGRGNGEAFAVSPRLNLDRVRILRDHVKAFEFPEDGRVVDVCLGLDIGSVGTKLILVDEHGDVVHSIFTRTQGRPIEVVSRCLKEVEESVGSRVRIRGVGTTGSGRELIGELVGADSVNDEITAHKTGATFVGDRLLGKRPDTIFEIGGQDSKFISLEREGGEGGDGSQDSVVVDFTMNEACAAGTGSFLEERAEELGVSIKGEFARLALQAEAPIKLGERCTVFMERDVNTCMQRGALRDNVIAGLAYSVAYNYINRVVRGRPIGDCVFFQGGTAYNDAVAAAFSMICGKEIIVPPHNAVLGAMGAALLARETIHATGRKTRFRGYDLGAVDYTLREFTCKACGNHCSVQQFAVDGEKTYWGDKCSERFRKQIKTGRKATTPDLVALRRELLSADDEGDPLTAERTIGIPFAMYAYDQLPLWRRFFRECGFRVVVSGETNQKIVRSGLDAIVAEPCFPITVAHGHAVELVERGVDYIWLPNVVSAETSFLDNESYVCPWGATLPFVLRQSPAVRGWPGRVLCPTLHLREGPQAIEARFVEVVSDLGVSNRVARDAFARALAAQKRFRSAYVKAGTAALEVLDRSGESGIVLVGRPYNIHDGGVSLSVARKLRDSYGVNVIPLDALPLDSVDVRDVHSNMFWEYGRKILAAARMVRDRPNLHLVYITNFKCGPDSFIKAYVREASGKPFLTLQFDGHSNDAGMMTRCEAYLDSKGILRWWRKPKPADEGRHSKDEGSTFRRCPTAVLD